MNNERHYTGQFSVAGQSISGELIYDDVEGTIILILTREYGRYDAEESFSVLDIITGKLNSGVTVTLFKNTCIYNFIKVPEYQTIHFSSSYMIWADTEIREPQASTFIFTLENALAWSELSNFDADYFNGIKLINERQAKSYDWFGAKIVFAPTINPWNTYPRQETIDIVQRLEVSIETEIDKPLDFYISVRDKIIALISFAIKDNVNIEKQYFIKRDDYYEVGENKEYIKYNVYTTELRRDIRKTWEYHYNFHLSQLDNSNNIGDTLLKLSPVFNLYLSLFKYKDMPTEMVFLNITQAIETFHARFFYNNNVKEYVKSVKERHESSPNYDYIRQLLLSNGQGSSKCQSIYLVSRINDLLFNSSIRRFLHYCSGENSNYGQKIVDTRNYFTHYDKNKEEKALKGDDLLEAIYILKLLLEYNICLVLGIDNKDKVQQELSDYERSKLISLHQSSYP